MSLFVFAPVCFTSAPAAGAEVLIGVPMDDGRCGRGGWSLGFRGVDPAREPVGNPTYIYLS